MRHNSQKEELQRKIDNESSNSDFEAFFIKSATPIENAVIQLLFSMGTLLSTSVNLRREHFRYDFKCLAVDEKQTDAFHDYLSRRPQTRTEEGAKP